MYWSQADRVDEEKLRLAILRLVSDNEHTFDDCLVRQFFRMLSKTMNARPMLTILKFVVELYGQPRLDTLNQERLLVLHQTIISEDFELAHLHKLNSVFWKKLPTLLQRASNVSYALAIINEIVRHKDGYLWIMDKRYIEPIELPPSQTMAAGSREASQVHDIATIAKHYMIHGQSYHVRNAAKSILVQCMRQSCRFGISPLHRLVVSAKQVVHDMMSIRHPAIFLALVETFEEIRLYQRLDEKYQIASKASRCFEEALANDSSDLIPIIKCFATTCQYVDIDPTIEKLKAKNNLEAIITFCRYLHEDLLTIMPPLIYVIYPILTSCDSEDAEALSRSLIITRSEKNFIKRNMKDKYVTSCINYTSRFFRRNLAYNSRGTTNIYKRLSLCLNVLNVYVRSNCTNPKAFGNVIECCRVLSDTYKLHSYRKEIHWLIHLVQGSIEMIKKLLDFKVADTNNLLPCEDSNSDNQILKPVLLETINMLKYAQHGCSYIKNYKMSTNLLNIVELAFKSSDHDVMNEFAQLFVKDRLIMRHLDSFDRYERYTELIWCHMYLQARNTDNRELLGHLADLLIEIDLEVEATTLAKFQIRRHHDIPRAIGDMLIEYSTNTTVVENVITSISNSGSLGDSVSGAACHSTNTHYLCFLDSKTLPVTVRPCLDKIIRGLCLAVKGDASLQTSREALNLINIVIDEMLINHSDEHYLISRLIKTLVLETLYEVITGSMYPKELSKLASKKINIIKNNIVMKLEKSKRSELIIGLIGSDNPTEYRLAQAPKVAEFYIAGGKNQIQLINQKMDDYRDGYGLALESYIDDILNQERISRLSECY